jgi:hypothetical protein
MPVRIQLFFPDMTFVSDLSGVTFTLSSKTSTGGRNDVIGRTIRAVFNAVLTGPTSVLSSGTSNTCF